MIVDVCGGNINWAATSGETFCHVQTRPDGLVHLYFPKENKWMALSIRPAFRLSWLIAKYALTSWIKNRFGLFK